MNKVFNFTPPIVNFIMAREFDAVLFGASGFTGQYAVEELALSMNMDELYKTNNLKWAVAGRSKDKIQMVLDEVEKNTNIPGTKNTPIIEADTSDYDSIVAMCKRTRLVINTVGPYRFYGEVVVKACIEAATHHVCVSGEPQYLEEMQLKYYEAANKVGVYIVGACGFDSIPADLGVSLAKKSAKGDLSNIDVIVSIKGNKEDKAPLMNVGTWNSALHSFANQSELASLRKELFDKILPYPKTRSKFPPKPIPVMGKIDEVEGVILPFLGSDRSVVKRSEVYKYNKFHERPVDVSTYIAFKTKIQCLAVLCVVSVFGCLAKFSLGRKMLAKYPRFCSFGCVSQDGVPRESLQGKSFTHTIIGYGWDEKYDDPDQQHLDPPKKKIVAKFVSPLDPGYIGTAAMLVHSGMTLLFDRATLPEPGVLSPGACFQNSYLMDRLSKRGIRFEVVTNE